MVNGRARYRCAVLRIWPLVGSLLVGFSGPARVAAQFAEDPPSGVYTHDGFMARVSFGPAYAVVHEQAQIPVLRDGRGVVDTAKLDLTGGGYAFALDAGYALSPSFALHGRLSQVVLPDPKLDGESPDGLGDNARTLALFAPALSWFGPFGLYADVAAGLAFTRKQTYEGEAGLGDPGIGANIDLGIDLWIAEQFAFGAVLRGWSSATWGSSDDGDRSQRALASAVALTLTYQ
jgi:hypothetical protein